MSVYIKGMEMPEERESFTVTIKYNGLVFDTETGIQVAEAQEIPPHGRLIDKDALLEDIDSNHIVTPSDDGNLVEVYGAEKILAHIAYAPTIIEAEGGE